jgi:hypothetical protein
MVAAILRIGLRRAAAYFVSTFLIFHGKVPPENYFRPKLIANIIPVDLEKPHKPRSARFFDFPAF